MTKQIIRIVLLLQILQPSNIRAEDIISRHILTGVISILPYTPVFRSVRSSLRRLLQQLARECPNLAVETRIKPKRSQSVRRRVQETPVYVPLKHSRDIIVIASIRKTRRLVAHLHNLAIRHHFPQHHALIQTLLALHKRLERFVHALHKRRVQRQLKRPAAELLASVESGGNVEQAVEYRVGHHAAHVCDGVESEEVGEYGFGFLFGAVVEELGEDYGGVLGGRAGEGDEEGLVSVVCGVEVVHEGYDLGERGGGEDKWAREDGVLLRVALEGEGGYYAEVCAGAADRPEEIWVRGCRGGDGFAGGEDDLGGEEVVDGEAVLSCEVAVAATECQAANTCVVDGSAYGCEAVFCGFEIDVFPDRPTFCCDSLGFWVDCDSSHL